MFTTKDVEYRTIFVVNCVDDNRIFRVKMGELQVERVELDGTKTLTRIPFQKVLALFVIGHATITTPFIEKCKKYNVALIVMKTTLRPVFFWADAAEANYLLRKKQHDYDPDTLIVAKHLICNKIENQKALLVKTRRKDEETMMAIDFCGECLSDILRITSFQHLMGIEGVAAKFFFEAYFQDIEWNGRKPRAKCDALNATLDIGYTILFNFIETFLRMYGFDLYVGVFHRLWFKRKSLVCDVMEPFRCIVDHTTLLAFHRGQFKKNDFDVIRGEYKLKIAKNKDYCRVYFDALMSYKKEIFLFVQNYYRQFMSEKYQFKKFKI